MTGRVDGPDKVTGRARYAFEHPVDGAAYVWAVSSVIAGATKPEQVRANVAAASWIPTAEDLAALDEAAPVKP